MRGLLCNGTPNLIERLVRVLLSPNVWLASLFLLLVPAPSPAQPELQSAAQPAPPCALCAPAATAAYRIPPLDLSAWPAGAFAQNAPARDPFRQSGSGNQPDPAASQDNSQPRNAGRQKQAEQKKKYAKSATTGSPKHIYWVIPAFHVSYGHFKPLTPKEKFQEWWQGVYDPLGLGVTAFQAGTLEYSSSDGFCGYGSGFANYMKCYGSMELDANDSSFLGDFVFTVWWHQDPRYFRLGHGGFGRRTLYAISRVFVTYNDSGKNVFYSSGLAGSGIAAVVSNLYYPKQDRGVGLTLSRVAIDLGDTALYNGAAEFWPEIHRWVNHHF